mmetsp:Transcript_18236/g.18993  ORF Transcript_18236/g.18993 Transcript_18236/m.18993 type:complete len:175 (-) Transcript_18236:120-644(-)
MLNKLILNKKNINNLNKNILICYFNTRRDTGSKSPYIENYRNTWPNTQDILPVNISEPYIPKRTISDEFLKFQLSSNFDRGSSIFYPHLNTHPGDLKIVLTVKVKDLPLNQDELPIFLRLVGTRYDGPKGIVRLVVKRFANRIENKRFSVLLLERLLAEARKLAKSGQIEYTTE